MSTPTTPKTIKLTEVQQSAVLGVALVNSLLQQLVEMGFATPYVYEAVIAVNVLVVSEPEGFLKLLGRTPDELDPRSIEQVQKAKQRAIIQSMIASLNVEEADVVLPSALENTDGKN